MHKIPILLALASTTAWQPAFAQTAEAEEQIIGTPWQAQIYSNFTGWTEQELAARDEWDLRHRCGGSLIADGWVLTAAHCISQDKVDKGYRVRLGAAKLDTDEGVTYRIDRMVRHADWHGDSHSFDIALVHFVADAETRDEGRAPIEPIALYDGPSLGDNVEVFATGWGQLEAGRDRGFQPELTQVDLRTADCARYPQYAGKVADYQLCATGRTPGDDADTCAGDSGGPLVMERDTPYQVGIVNWGLGCYRAGSAGIYLRIDNKHFRDWIARAMASDPTVNELR